MLNISKTETEINATLGLISNYVSKLNECENNHYEENIKLLMEQYE